jgi:hypothetical protein
MVLTYCSAWLESNSLGQSMHLKGALAYCEFDTSRDWTVVGGNGNAPNVGGEKDELGNDEGNRGDIMTSTLSGGSS